MKVAVIFDNFGPYHLSRLRAAARVCELTAIEVAVSSGEYAWQREAQVGSQESGVRSQETEAGVEFKLSGFSISDFKTVTLLGHGTSREVKRDELVQRMNQILDECRPQVVFIPGWSGRAAFAALHWCVRHGVPAVAMSESTEWDSPRRVWSEEIKRQIVGLFSVGLAGGTPHKDYITKLGMPAERVFLGYDAVDNRYFEDKVAEVRSRKSEVRSLTSDRRPLSSDPYFLASARFIEKKNLPRLIEAFASYRKKAEMLKSNPEVRSQKSDSAKSESGKQKAEIENKNEFQLSEFQLSAFSPWDLVLLGDGPLKPDLCRLVSDLRLQDSVLLHGFIQYPELPEYYARAGAFVHASTSEQWGLVVNEAMASGLPVLVSNRCGCAQDLVQEGVNGFTFDPYDVEQLAQLMVKISDFRFPISDFGKASLRIVNQWGPERFASGLKQAVECAHKVGPVKPSLVQRALIAGLLWR